jgi:prephenate dehydratase
MVLFFQAGFSEGDRQSVEKALAATDGSLRRFWGGCGGSEFLLLPDVEDAAQVRLSSLPGVSVAFPIQELPLAERLLMQLAGEPGLEADCQVAFQGVRGAYSEIAIRQIFGDTVRPVACNQFREVFEAVDSGRVPAGALPLENALAGSILDNYDLFQQYPGLSLCGETYVRVNHHLIGMPGAAMSDVKRVFSHPQGLAQSAEFLDAHPEWERVSFFDTAGSVEHVKQLGLMENAAIASGIAATIYGMQVLYQGTETNPKNFTRFGVVMRNDAQKLPAIGASNGMKASVVFSLPHRPGTLLNCLQVMADQGLNVSKIESRPIAGRPWEYLFYLDVDTTVGLDRFYVTCRLLEGMTEQLRVIGLYPRSTPPA